MLHYPVALGTESEQRGLQLLLGHSVCSWLAAAAWGSSAVCTAGALAGAPAPATPGAAALHGAQAGDLHQLLQYQDAHDHHR